ncbi:hypothetical protein V6N11_063545 [Hibiscus sabdariffa]|uniref:Uncharacterized protein n=2 Tax=Hibiscus sabdariffa TaxID=183260 RepID=A0ABR2BP46_9ROSI
MLVLVSAAAGKEGKKPTHAHSLFSLKLAKTIFAMNCALVSMEKKLKEFVLALPASVLTLVNSCFSSGLAL